MNPKWVKTFIASRIGYENRMMKLDMEWSNANIQIQGQSDGYVDNAGGQVRPVNPIPDAGQSGGVNPVNWNGDQRP